MLFLPGLLSIRAWSPLAELLWPGLQRHRVQWQHRDGSITTHYVRRLDQRFRIGQLDAAVTMQHHPGNRPDLVR